jgi:hypothetical protein
VKDFRPPARNGRPDFPTFMCSEIDRSCGHVCGLEAEWQATWSANSACIRTYCAAHKPDHATRIPLEAKFMLTRIEVRVAVPHLPGDPFDAADQATRLVLDALEGAGGLVVGFHVLGQKASSDGLERPPLRLQLAGRPEPAVRADRPFWGFLSGRDWARASRGKKAG